MSIYYARPKQTLKAHLSGVANWSRQLALEALPILSDDIDSVRRLKESFHDRAWMAGLLHDLGKYRHEFQEYLAGTRTRGLETNHSVYGAAAAAFSFTDEFSAFTIAGHHAGLYDACDLDSLINGIRYQSRAVQAQLLPIAEKDVGGFPKFDPIGLVDGDDKERHRFEFMTRMLFSVLVDADRLDAEKAEMEQNTGKPWQRQAGKFDPDDLLQRIQTLRAQKRQEHPQDELNRVRNDIFDACVENGEKSSRRFFSLTVPTGGGKTLSSMAFALAHAKKHGLRRIIVVIPYLSIIEQNAREYRSVFGDDIVLEHHSAIDLPHRPVSDEPSSAQALEKATENWDMPVIVTTSVQFIETLFAASPGKARKLHNIPRSVVIFDEVQTLPVHLLEPTLNVLRDLKENWGCSFLFCSATPPVFKKSPSLKNGFEPGELTAIISNPETVFKQLRRVTYEIKAKESPLDWQAVAEKMISHPQTLCVLNIRRQAFALWDALHRLLCEKGLKKETEEALFHLSSSMCPAHRLDLLGLSKNPPPNNIKNRLTQQAPCWVASTQLIEAGVDIDFPVLFRAMGPLDSIVQAAGRCNREGRLRDEHGDLCLGKVFVFSPSDGGLPPGIYSTGTSITPTYLKPDELAACPDLFSKYFNELYQYAQTDFVRRGQPTIQQDRAAFMFRRVAKHAKVIKDETVSVLVPYGKGKEMVENIRRTQHFDFRTLRSLQRYMVNIRNSGFNSDFAKLQQLGAISPLLPSRLEIPVLEEWCYKTNPPLGVVIENRPMEDFIQ